MISLPRTQPLMSSHGGATGGRQGAGRRRGNAVGHAHNCCMACRLGPWRAASRHASPSDVADRSPPPTSMGGGRSSSGKRRDLRTPQLSHEGQQAKASQQVVNHRGASPQIFRQVPQLPLLCASGSNLQATPTMSMVQGILTHCARLQAAKALGLSELRRCKCHGPPAATSSLWHP